MSDFKLFKLNQQTATEINTEKTKAIIQLGFDDN